MPENTLDNSPEIRQSVAKPDPLLTPDEAPGDMPDIGREFTTSGTDKGDWKKQRNKKQVNNRDMDQILL